MKYSTVKTKSKILNLYKNIDPWFWISGSINPYRGCEHGCLYCDGRASYYKIPDYSTHIRIKINAPELLRNELLKLGFRPINYSKTRYSKTGNILNCLDNSNNYNKRG